MTRLARVQAGSPRRSSLLTALSVAFLASVAGTAHAQLSLGEEPLLEDGLEEGLPTISDVLTDTSASPASRVGRWDPVLLDGEVPAVSAAVMHDGRLLYWSGVEAHEEDHHGTLDYYAESTFVNGHVHEAQTRVLDLSTSPPTITTPEHPEGYRPGDLFCSALTIRPDGHVMTVGGTDWQIIAENLEDFPILYGLKYAQAFDPALGDWRPLPDMNAGRWYPTAVTLSNGEVFVASGLQHFTTSTMVTAAERFDGEAWIPAGDETLPMYPRLTLVPSGPYKGKVFYNTSGQLWGPSGGDPREPLWNLQKVCDPWNDPTESARPCRDLTPSLLGARQHGTVVMYPLDPADGYRARFVHFSGTLNRSTAATNLAEVVDLGTDPPTNSIAEPLEYPRWMSNGVLLPDGKILAVGGAAYDNVVVYGQPDLYLMNAELFDPDSGTWSTMAPMQVPRAYHSIAILLPDGRVMTGGTATLPFPSRALRDGVPYDLEEQVIERRLEFFEPPYLHRGPRPVVEKLSESRVGYGEIFEAKVKSPSPVHSAMLVRAGATTHGLDMDQRGVYLAFEELPNGRLRLLAPPDGDVAPPGYYMLFVNRSHPEGPVPSVAAWVHVSDDPRPG